MKTIKLLTTAVIFSVAIATTAVERPKLNIIPVNEEKAIVAVNNEKAVNFELGIYTVSGEMVYYKRTSERLKDYSRVFDFKDLGNGKYMLKLKINDTEVNNEFEVTNEGVWVGEKRISYDPYFTFDNDELRLSFLNFDQHNLTLYIYDRNGLIYEKELGREFNVVKGLDLSNLRKGTYQVVLNSPDREFSYNIIK